MVFLQQITDSAGYRIGYSIGSWLPFIVLGLFLTIMILAIRKRSSKGQDSQTDKKHPD